LPSRLSDDLNSLEYSREIESRADVTGSDICAQAGYNPWGSVWLFKEFKDADTNQIPQLLSDHPADGTRMQTLEPKVDVCDKQTYSMPSNHRMDRSPSRSIRPANILLSWSIRKSLGPC
jgi:predicted Zn-dependent protease